MSYTVQQLADLAGVSVRTLHHYDEIGLLTPARLQGNEYRIYEEAELMRLQQILFFRELEFSLDDIKKIVSDPAFDMQAALRDHRRMIEAKQKRLSGLIGTIDTTLAKLSGTKEVSDEELFEAFWEKHETEYVAEAEQRWGNTDAYKQSKERTKHFTKEDYKRMAKDGDLFMQKFPPIMSKGPYSKDAQELIAQHFEGLRTFYEPTLELYRGLGTMYVEDDRFRAYYAKYHKDLPEFMRDAMHAYADGQEGK